MAFKFNYITPPENGIQAIFRFLSTILVRFLARTPVTPNHITYFRTFIATCALYLFSVGDHLSLLWAAGLFYVFEILDHVDGDLARFTKQFSKVGPLLEQFVDTWSSRPSNIFGLSIAIGMYNQSGNVIGFILFGATVFGRLMWLEYREYFGWVHSPKSDTKEYQRVLSISSPKMLLRNLFEILYIWNNTFLLLAALFYTPIQNWFEVNPLVIAFTVVAILNNIPWLVIVISGFSKAHNNQP